MRQLTWQEEDDLAKTRSALPRHNWLNGRAYKFNTLTRCFVSLDGHSISEEMFEIERIYSADKSINKAILTIVDALSNHPRSR
jgi:hypothetical protein